MANKPRQLDIQPRRPVPAQQTPSFNSNPDTLPCPVCGGTKYEWGRLHGVQGYSNTPLPIQAKPVHARLCLSCGNVMTFLRQ